MAPKPKSRPITVAKSKVPLSAGWVSAFTGYRPGQSQYQARVRARPLAWSVNSPLKVDDLLLNLEHPVADDQAVSRGERHHRIGRFLDLLDEVAVDHDRVAVEPRQCNHIDLQVCERGRRSRRPPGTYY